MSNEQWPPRVIMNTDGNWILGYLERHEPDDITASLDKLAGAGLDALSVLVGVDDGVSWRGSPHTEMWGDEIEQRDPGVETEERLRTISSYLKKLHSCFAAVIEDGRDLMQIYIDAARKRNLGIYLSYRMNDAHTTDERREWQVRTQLKLDRPDLLIGSPLPESTVYPDWGFSWQWNYAREEVRARFLGLFDETLERYDCDGLDVDFCRQPPFFAAGQAVRNIATMTDFMREARAIVRRHSSKRGRDLRLITRVPPSIDQSLEIGIDTETWIREGLADVVVLASTSLCAQQIDITRAVQAASGTDVNIFNGFDTGTYQISPQEGYERNQHTVLRAAALNGYRSGAAGIHLFNFDIRHHRAMPYEGDDFTEDHLQFLSDVGDPSRLEQGSRCYYATHYSHGDRDGYHNGDYRPQLPRKLALLSRGAGPEHRVWITIEDDIAAGLQEGRIKQTELRVRMTDHESNMARIRCEINGKQFDFSPSGTIENSSGFVWMVFADPPLQSGANSILLALEGTSSPDPWPIVRQIEAVVLC